MLSLPIRTRIAVAAGITAFALGAPAGAYALTLDPTVGAATNVAVRTTAPGAVTVSWAATSILSVLDWEIVLTETSADGTTSHSYFQPAAARTLTVSDLPAGAKVHALVATFAGARALNISLATPDVTVPAGLCAGVSGACVAADTSQSQGVEQHVAQGFLHGLGLTNTGVQEMQALQPTSWRITEGSPSEISAVQAFHPATTAMLSDPWYEITVNPQTHAAMSPWENWSAYTWFVKTEVQKRIAAGNLPDYWDIQNEPDLKAYYDPAFPPTAALIEQQFNVAYTAIKSVLPSAKIIGPSFGGFNLVGDASHIALLDFINYATANNLQFAAISWHENNAGNGTQPSLQLPVLADHVQMIRTALDASPVLAGAQIFVNEFDSSFTGRLTGWDLGHVIALEQAGVDQANRACFENCMNGGDSLLDPTDNQTPRMTYWGRLAYAQMTGTRVATTTGQRDTTGMTTVDNTAHSLTTIIARHHGCSVGGNTDCPTGLFVTPTDSGPLTLALKLPGSAAGDRATVSVTTLAATVADSAKKPAATVSTVKVPRSSLASVRLGSLPDGAAYVVKVSWS
jgi:hypothetical protein